MKKLLKRLSQFENQWIVTDRKYSKVLLANKDLKILQKDVEKNKIKDSVVMFVPSHKTTLSPVCR